MDDPSVCIGSRSKGAVAAHVDLLKFSKTESADSVQQS